MKESSVDKVLQYFSIFFFFCMSGTILLIPLPYFTEMQLSREYTVFTGLLIWVSLFIGIALQIVAYVRVRKYRKKYPKCAEKLKRKRIGVIDFFSNIPAVISDCALAIGIIGFVISYIFTSGSGYLCYVFLFITVFSFALHCILNGRLYSFAVNKSYYLS